MKHLFGLDVQRISCHRKYFFVVRHTDRVRKFHKAWRQVLHKNRMKFFTLKKLLQYFLPATLTLFMLLTIERNVDTDMAYEKLYGLPLPFISSAFAFTHHFDVYMLTMLVDFLFYLSVTLLFFKLLEASGLNLKTHWIFISTGIIISIFWLFVFYETTFESTFKFVNDFDFRTTSSELRFGTYPW